MHKHGSAPPKQTHGFTTILLRNISPLQKIASARDACTSNSIHSRLAMTVHTRQVAAASRFEGNNSKLKTKSVATSLRGDAAKKL